MSEMRFVDCFAMWGARDALIFPYRPAISYAELDRRVTKLADELGSKKKLIAIQACKSEHSIISYLAALKGGHAVALLPPCSAAAMADFAEDFAPDIEFRQVDGRWCRYEDTQRADRPLHRDLAILLGTSGSTGRSRFVRLSAFAIEANARSIADYLELNCEDRAALILPWHYSYGLSVINSHLAVGGSVYVAEKSASDAAFATEMRAAACTNIAGVPHSYEMMQRTGFLEESLPALRLMTAAGGRMPVPLAERIRRHLEPEGKQLFLMYGQTEATARIAYVPPGDLASNADAIGMPIPGGSLRLIDDGGSTIERCGVPGELVYRGANIMMGYAQTRSDLTRDAEITELRTGDIAERKENGFYRIVGRTNRFSKIAGLRINHEAVEATLSARGITAAVIGDDRRLAVVVASGHAEKVVLQTVVAASGLTPLHIDVHPVSALPRVASGKIDYAQMRGLLSEQPVRSGENVIEVFRRAFYPRKVSSSESFEDLGGDSLLFVQMSLTLERRLGHLPDGWERIPARDLVGAGHIDAGWRPISSDLMLRALAIMLIVVHHATLWPIPGGAATLMMLVGYGLARFHSAALLRGETGRLLKSLALNLAIYAPIVAGFSLARGEILWPSVFLIGNFGMFGPEHMLPYVYWFVEAYAQIVLLCAGLFSIPSVRRAVTANPLSAGLLFLALTVAVKFATPLVWDIGWVQVFSMPDVLYLAVIGWCIHFARTRKSRLILIGATLAICPLMAYWGGNWTGSWVRYTLVFASVTILLYLPRLRLPAWAIRAALSIAAASYHIYLFHRILPVVLLPKPDVDLSHPFAAALAVISGILVGLGAYTLQNQAIAWFASRRRQLPSSIAAE